MNDYLKNLNRIEFVVTMACTGRCKHCSQGEHISNGEHIDGDVAANTIIDVCKHYKIESLMTFGGEPLFPRATSQADMLACPFGDCREGQIPRSSAAYHKLHAS